MKMNLYLEEKNLLEKENQNIDHQYLFNLFIEAMREVEVTKEIKENKVIKE